MGFKSTHERGPHYVFELTNGVWLPSFTGDQEHDSADRGCPIKIGGKASTALPAAVANADRVDAYFDQYGRLGVFLPSTGVAVAGPDADGAASSGNPVQIAGKDSDGNIQSVVVDSSGRIVTRPYVNQAVAAATNDLDVHIPAAATAAVLNIDAGASGISNCIEGIYWSYSEDPTGGNVKIEDGAGNTIFSLDITSAGPGFLPVTRKGSAATAMIVTLASGGGTVVGKINVGRRWQEKTV